jgi:hypothetical protein
LSREAPPERLKWWIFLHLLMREISSLMTHGMRSSSEDFGDLNRDVIGPSSDDNIIILSDSDKEEEDMREEKTIGTEDAATSAAVNPASTASIDDASTG